MKKTAIIFPGQGSQYLGMGQEFIQADNDAARLMELAEDISGFPLTRLCSDGPLEDLTRVLHLQPAMTVVNLMCWQQLKKALPEFTPAWVGGHSLGEYSALHASGVLSASDTLALVTKRGEFMEREGSAHPGGMRAILGLGINEIDRLNASYDGDGTVVVANHNTQQQIIISGDNDGLNGLSLLCEAEGAKVIPLPVSVANHSPLVAGAVKDFSAYMETVSFNMPQIPLLFNATATVEKEPSAIRNIMASQIASRVRWCESVTHMIDDGVEVFVELGPKKVLSGLMRKLLPRRSSVQCLQADTPELLEKVVAVITG